MASRLELICGETLFCRTLIAAAGEARDAVTELGQRLLAQHLPAAR